jgi:hypothetical protein
MEGDNIANKINFEIISNAKMRVKDWGNADLKFDVEWKFQ